MADTDYTYSVRSDTTTPFGPVSKENLDVVRFVYDFTCWLEDLDGANTTIGAVVYPIAAVAQGQAAGWRTDYPPTDTLTTDPPVDEFPMAVQEITVIDNATKVEVLVTSGTPGFMYAVSFVAQATSSNRRKQVDTLVNIEEPINPNMVSGPAQPTPSPSGPPLTINDDTVLNPSFTGRIYVLGGTVPLTVTLPITPAVGSTVSPVDINGVATTYPITYAAASGDNIEGHPTFVSDISYDDLTFEFVGDHWIVLTRRFACLG